MPPSFYEADLSKWMDKKFENAIKKRKQSKENDARLGQTNAHGSLNQNCTKPLPKRRYSRASAPTFTNIDFDVTGNTLDVDHLIRHASRGHKHAPTDLNFELNLRRWKAPEDVKMHDAPFQYPQATKVDPVQLFKDQFMPLKGRTL